MQDGAEGPRFVFQPGHEITRDRWSPLDIPGPKTGRRPRVQQAGDRSQGTEFSPKFVLRAQTFFFSDSEKYVK